MFQTLLTPSRPSPSLSPSLPPACTQTGDPPHPPTTTTSRQCFASSACARASPVGGRVAYRSPRRLILRRVLLKCKAMQGGKTQKRRLRIYRSNGRSLGRSIGRAAGSLAHCLLAREEPTIWPIARGSPPLSRSPLRCCCASSRHTQTHTGTTYMYRLLLLCCMIETRSAHHWNDPSPLAIPQRNA